MQLQTALKEKPGGANHVLAELASQHAAMLPAMPEEKCEIVRKSMVYFTNNANKMNYAAARAAGLPIGSGPVEATCKTLVVQRMKNSGMSWLWPGGQAVLTLRRWQQSARYDIAWQRLQVRFDIGLQPHDTKVRKTPSYQTAA